MRHSDQLDEMLATGLRQALDLHRGRSLAAFQAEEGSPARQAHARWRMRPVVGLLSGLATAAIVAVAIWAGARLLVPDERPAVALSELPVLVDAAPQVQRVTMWRTYDRGPVVLEGNVPVRRYHRQVVQQVRWRDPQTQAEIAWTVPRQDVVLVQMTTH